MDSTTLKNVVDIVQGSVTTIAIVAGGVWGYIKVIRGRVYRPRLEPTVTGRIVRSPNAQYAVVKISVKNVGLSRVELNNSQSTLEAEAYPQWRYFPEFHNAITARLGVINVLCTHEWVEPGECIVEERLVALPDEELLALVLKLRLVQRATQWRSEKASTEWNAIAVADAAELSSSAQTHPTQPSSEENGHESAGVTKRIPAAAATGGRGGVEAASGGAAPPEGTGGGNPPKVR